MADASTTVSLAPYVDIIKPYVDVVVQSAVTAIVGLIALKINQYFNIQISKTQLDKLKSAAATEAGALVAGAEDNLKSTSVNVGSQMVADAANRVAQRLPDAAKAVGATPEALQAIVAGEIGKLQAANGGSSTAIATASAPPEVTKTEVSK
jgi:hypothetical protein